MDQEESTRFNTELARTIGVEPERYLEAWLTATDCRTEHGPAADHFQALFGELGVESSVDECCDAPRAGETVLVPRPDALPRSTSSAAAGTCWG